MGGILSRPRSQKIFACGGPKIVFLVFLKLKIFRLRRAKNHVLCVFRPKKFLACGGHPPNLVFKNVFYGRRNALLLFTQRSSSRADTVPCVFTSIETRFYYS